MTARPTVSVIVVNWNGREHLTTCFRSLEASEYPRERLELILVDNGSTDGSLELMRRLFPRVRLVALPSNLGFTGGNNAGSEAASGEILVFFNNDMRIDAGAIPALVAALDDHHPCAAARVLSWNGRRIDFLRGTTSFEARGFQEHYGEPRERWLDYDTTTFSPNGGAFAVTRAAYRRCGGFDDRFFAYYDDVDLGWRLRLVGSDVRVVPDAIVYHRHGATSRRFPSPQKRFLMERNALWTTLKNYGDETLSRTLGPILLLAAARIVLDTRLSRSAPQARALAPFSARCRRSARAASGWPARDVYQTEAQSSDSQGQRTRLIRRFPSELLAGVGAALEELPEVAADRRAVQQRRVVADSAVLPLMGRGLAALSSARSYLEAQRVLVAALGLEPMFAARSRILLASTERAGAAAADGALALGRALSSSVSVAVALPALPAAREEDLAVVPYDPARASSLRRLAIHFDAVIADPETVERFPFLADIHLPLAANLLFRAHAPQAGSITLREADFFLCSDESQRAAWKSALVAAGRVPAGPRPPDAVGPVLALMHLARIDHHAGTDTAPRAGDELGAVRRFCVKPQFAPDRAGRVEEFERRLEQSFRISKTFRRCMLALGVSERSFEHFKQWAPVRAAMSVRNRVAITRARKR
jgi:GT2 family glycosyltransferase